MERRQGGLRARPGGAAIQRRACGDSAVVPRQGGKSIGNVKNLFRGQESTRRGRKQFRKGENESLNRPNQLWRSGPGAAAAGCCRLGERNRQFGVERPGTARLV